MRRLRYRFTVRRMMVVVAMFAVALGANDLRRRRNRYLDLSSTHDWAGRGCSFQAESYAATAAQNEREAERIRATLKAENDPLRKRLDLVADMASTIARAAADQRDLERRQRSLARYHDALRSKYARAARNPWLPVAPDPPVPEDGR